VKDPDPKQDPDRKLLIFNFHFKDPDPKFIISDPEHYFVACATHHMPGRQCWGSERFFSDLDSDSAPVGSGSESEYIRIRIRILIKIQTSVPWGKIYKPLLAIS